MFLVYRRHRYGRRNDFGVQKYAEGLSFFDVVFGED